MKHKQSFAYFADQRSNELLSAFRKVLDSKPYFDVSKDFTIVADQPCSRFWVSEERAFAIISAMLRGQPILNTMLPLKQEMFSEIYNRVLSIRQQHPDMSLADAVFLTVNSPAPKFYISPLSARNLVYQTLRQRKKAHLKKEN